jgi:hypothetical protein
MSAHLAQPRPIGASEEAIQGERRQWPFGHSPQTLLSSSLQTMALFVDALKRLRATGDHHAQSFTSDGFRRFFAMIDEELPNAYFAEIEERLDALQLKSGTLLTARLGPGNKGAGYVLRIPPEQSWRERLTSFHHDGLSFQVPERDQAGARAISDLAGLGIDAAANALGQATQHILSFFKALLTELAFYLGAINLHELLAGKGQSTCMPEPAPRDHVRLSARALSDVSLSLTLRTQPVTNDLDADGIALIMITGANQGGKSTFLRAIALAQLMMQSGLFVAADAFTADLRNTIFTHYKCEEDAAMEHGKLAEELARMSAIADDLHPGDMLLCNESFGSTNEREGSEISRQVLRACTEAGIKVVFVTHLFDLAYGLAASRDDNVLFLRADRGEDGERTFRISEGAPLPTSYGEDTYRRVFVSGPLR